jgi:hypothetical protein
MIKNIAKKTGAAKAVIYLGAAATVGFILACAEPPQRVTYPPFPASEWGDSFSYNYEPPTKAPPASVNATIIVVNPFYKDAESSMLDPVYSQVGRGFSRSMGVDLDKVIIAKGMTSVGPYATLDDVPYPDKKNADLTLAPRLFLTTDTKFGEWRQTTYSDLTPPYHGADASSELVVMQRDFEMRIGGWVAYEMREPLSGEKMWVKKLNLDESTVRGIEIYQARPVYETRYGGQYNNEPYQALVRYDRGDLIYNGRGYAIADALKTFYPQIMGKAWTYLDAQEILNLKSKTKEIRVMKRY